MDEDRARELLRAERDRVQRILEGSTAAGNQDRENDRETVSPEDRSESLAAQGVDDAVSAHLRERLAEVERAEQRLADGKFGRSVRSGKPIPDGRLEADPAAELTVEEAEAGA